MWQLVKILNYKYLFIQFNAHIEAQIMDHLARLEHQFVTKLAWPTTNFLVAILMSFKSVYSAMYLNLNWFAIQWLWDTKLLVLVVLSTLQKITTSVLSLWVKQLILKARTFQLRMTRVQVHRMIDQWCYHILSAENSKTWMRRCDKRWVWSVGKACQGWNIRNRSKRQSFRLEIQGNLTIQFWMASQPRLQVPWIFRRMKQPARYTQNTFFKWIRMRPNFNQLREQHNLWLLLMMRGLLRETLGLHRQEIHPC